MVSIVSEVPEQYDSITRSAFNAVIEQVMVTTGVSKEARLRVLPPDTQQIQPGAEMQHMDEFGGKILFPSTDKVKVSVREEFIPEEILTSTVRRPQHPVIFKDPALFVDIYPSYQWVRSITEFELRFQDRASAMKWYSGFQRALSQRRAQQTHTLVYHYPIPEPFLIILQEIHRLRELQGGYGQTLPEYVAAFGSPNLTSIVNQAGNNRTVVMKETEHEVVGHFDFEASVPKPETQGSTGTHYCQFSYVVEYQKPVSVVMHYPNMVHNTLMPSDMLNFDKPYDVDKLLAARGSLDWQGFRAVMQLAGNYIKAGAGAKGLSIPGWDDWIPNYIRHGEAIMFSGLCAITQDDKKTLMSLKDMGPYTIDPLFIAYLEENPNMLTSLTESPIRAYLYNGYTPYWGDTLDVSSDLVVASKTDLDIRGYYHILFSLVFDLNTLSDVGKNRLMRHGEFTRKLLAGLSDRFLQPNTLPPLMPNGQLRMADLEKAFRILQDAYRTPVKASAQAMLTTAICIIDAKSPSPKET